jgi:hypothetical protein
MTRGLFAASAMVAATLAIGPASSGLIYPLAQRAGTSVQRTDPVGTTTPTSDTASRPTLSMVPRNPKLESRLHALLPPGMTVRQAAQGFGDQNQFVSTVHVSRNLDIPFIKLKAKIVDERLSLGQAIQALRPDADVSKELTRAREMTPKDIY